MYVCICHGVTDKDIRAAANNGANSLEALGEQLNVATCCGRCADCARSVLLEVIQSPACAPNCAAAA
ncbi:(2Fe-2S)-binding protein [Sedimenticola selenatireducens]|uniref:Bacterioferritin-associated ferredoxin n=1 Tax=Sedimenticola selenatireducens TaxID=191960 RepID=A0A2N6D093_9GAMM|nr:(2Fe-2S)-binding protein [Sedimenticola selenatireducens]PLX63085.1 MAG: (2Fe-2S)-binding protein [Sedimenticola selenatireducens]